ncbi:hypothetical protein DPEC_G00232560 [Dallia pectoralis]|uniref:Uncharacterized protein n=1 Tax=Dallia pectoralis TaxID=75939 RepID=A0ACC2FXI6_DALPE|nr:hypothetical protein DPEC_G00232560 [Dallia pectoralis]
MLREALKPRGFLHRPGSALHSTVTKEHIEVVLVAPAHRRSNLIRVGCLNVTVDQAVVSSAYLMVETYVRM